MSDEHAITNIMRHEYRELGVDDQTNILRIKNWGLDFHVYLDKLGSSRELSLAKTKIEEAVMWAVKGVSG